MALHGELTMNETLFYFGVLHRMKLKDIRARRDFLKTFLELPTQNRLVRTFRYDRCEIITFIFTEPVVLTDKIRTTLINCHSNNFFNILSKIIIYHLPSQLIFTYIYTYYFFLSEGKKQQKFRGYVGGYCIELLIEYYACIQLCMQWGTKKKDLLCSGYATGASPHDSR